jgi:hypothetical protein
VGDFLRHTKLFEFLLVPIFDSLIFVEALPDESLEYSGKLLGRGRSKGSKADVADIVRGYAWRPRAEDLLIEDEAAAQRTLALRIRSIEHNNASATSRASR